MPLLAWVILGLVAGFVASKIAKKSDEGFVLDIVLGMLGAVVSGWLFTTFGTAGVINFNLYSLLVAAIGAALLLTLSHTVYRGSR